MIDLYIQDKIIIIIKSTVTVNERREKRHWSNSVYTEVCQAARTGGSNTNSLLTMESMIPAIGRKKMSWGLSAVSVLLTPDD